MDDYIVLDQNKFILKQFHFHTPSENQINGITYPMEIHFVHADEQGDLAVLAVMFELGQSNNEITKLWKSISKKENDVKEIKRIVNLEKLLPEVREYYRFTGSLTTPPCDEGVNWIVLKKPLQISQEQIDTFKNILKQPSNNRPIQQTNGRIIIE
jgi:carbonic anhydrase